LRPNNNTTAPMSALKIGIDAFMNSFAALTYYLSSRAKSRDPDATA
jgi:hypothetical protein